MCVNVVYNVNIKQTLFCLREAFRLQELVAGLFPLIANTLPLIWA